MSNAGIEQNAEIGNDKSNNLDTNDRKLKKVRVGKGKNAFEFKAGAFKSDLQKNGVTH
jgi:hypothetical protein